MLYWLHPDRKRIGKFGWYASIIIKWVVKDAAVVLEDADRSHVIYKAEI